VSIGKLRLRSHREELEGRLGLKGGTNEIVLGEGIKKKRFVLLRIWYFSY